MHMCMELVSLQARLAEGSTNVCNKHENDEPHRPLSANTRNPPRLALSEPIVNVVNNL